VYGSQARLSNRRWGPATIFLKSKARVAQNHGPLFRSADDALYSCRMAAAGCESPATASCPGRHTSRMQSQE